MKNLNHIKNLLILTVVSSLSIYSCSETNKASVTDDLYKEFQNPPNEAKPRVWWHWMNGNITKDGIRKDLEWMHRIGIGGFQNFDAGMTTPQIVEHRLSYMTPEWKDAFLFTTKLADSLNLEMAIAGSPGWSESGGPWVEPKDGMKKIVWSEIQVNGGSLVSEKLPAPPSVSGTFQNIGLKDEIQGLSGKTPTPPSFYQDISVVAYRLPATYASMKEMDAKVTSSGGSFSLDQLTDGNLATTSLLPVNQKNEFAWIQFEFPKPQTIKAITIVGGESKSELSDMMGNSAVTRFLDAGDDGINFKTIAELPTGALPELSINIEPQTAKFFRVKYKNPAPVSMPNIGIDLSMFGGLNQPASKGTEVAEIVLFSNSIVDRFEEKAGFTAYSESFNSPKSEASDEVDLTGIIDITDKMNADGLLNWTPPAGKWKIMRLGYSLTGKQNHPASFEATGLEVDKMDANAVSRYFENYLNQYKDATGGVMGAKGLQYLVTDSYEAGQENWTPAMAQEFEKRRGYSLIPWLPVLTGKIVKSAGESEKFLWNYRQTIGELIAENHYDNLTHILEKYGMKRYSESHENKRAYIVDGMDVKRTAAVPMSACWVGNLFGSGQLMHEADIRESASVSHIYGQNLVAAESFTAVGLMGNAFSYDPASLKPTADLELASGLNRFVIHTSVHQPVDDKIPGLGLSIFGQWFTRHETWAEQAKSWTDYLTRSCYMLQKGNFVADVIYYYGENNNITNLFGKKLPDIPEGYAYDFINPYALLNLLTVKNGKLVTPSGMNYSVLALDANSKLMTLPVLRKISELVKSGAVVIGSKPVDSPSLNDNRNEFIKLANELWLNEKRENTIGKGKVFAGQSIHEVLNKLKISPDFTYSKPKENTSLKFVHRQLNDIDFYWVSNRNERVEDLEVTFRVAGREAEIWQPETGAKKESSYTIENGITKVPLHLEPNEAVFIVFSNKAKETFRIIPAPSEKTVASIEGPWMVKFQEKKGAPVGVTFNELTPWNESADIGVKYFSGTATYSKTINAPADWFGKDTELWIDLGKVENLAEVVINGKSLGVVWKTPFRINATDALKIGDNKLEIKVTNLWVNRLIGDQQPGAVNKITYTTMPFYRANSPLLPSGLLGPVKIITQNK